MLLSSVRRGAFVALLFCLPPVYAQAQTSAAPAGNGTGNQAPRRRRGAAPGAGTRRVVPRPAAPANGSVTGAAPSGASPNGIAPSGAAPSGTSPLGTPPAGGAVTADSGVIGAPNSIPVTNGALSTNGVTLPNGVPDAAVTSSAANAAAINAATAANANAADLRTTAEAGTAAGTDGTDAAPKVGLPARGTMTVSGTAEKLSVFAVGVDAPQLLTAIAARAGLKLVVDDTISRKITISVKALPAREIIASIAGAYGLAAADVEGVTIISEGIPRGPSSYLLSDIDQISTKYVDAANARNLLPVFLQDYVKVNSEQNAVVLSAPAEVLRKFRADIAGFDIPASQILVDLLLVELTDSGVDQLNLTLNYGNSGNVVSLSPNSGSLVYQALTTLPEGFSASLSALQEKGRARVRANPRIATVSGRRASIFVGRQRYIVTPIDTGQGQRNFIDAGVKLEITPYTGGEKQIIVDVNAEVSTLSALDPVTRLPEKSTRTANTKVRVGDGQTIVIGGLKQQETRDVETRVPVLGNLPILGPLLFRSRNKRSTNTELVLFITPRILSDTGHLPQSEEDALKNRFLAPNLGASMSPAPAIDAMPRFQDAAPFPATPAPIAPVPTLDAPLPNAPLPNAPLPNAPLPNAPLPNAPLPNAPLPNAPLPNAPRIEAPRGGLQLGGAGR